MNERSLNILKELTNAPGASGFEDAVVAIARKYVEGIGEVKEDFLRNLYIYRKENTGAKPVVMLDAHSDEVGLIIQHIKPNGTLRFLPLGGWNKNALPSSKVLVRNALGEYIPGIIAAKPVHFMSAAEKQGSALELDEMVIDIGARSAKEAKEDFHIRIGEHVVDILADRANLAGHGQQLFLIRRQGMGARARKAAEILAVIAERRIILKGGHLIIDRLDICGRFLRFYEMILPFSDIGYCYRIQLFVLEIRKDLRVKQIPLT